MQISFAAERSTKNPRVENAGIQSPDCETRRNAPGLPDSVFAQDLPDTGQPLRDHAVVAQVGTVVAVDGSLGVPAEEPFAVEEVDVVVLLRQPPHHPVRGVDPLAVEFRGLLIEVACGVPVGLHEDQRFVGMGLDERRHERVEALADHLRGGVRKGVEQEGVGVGLGEQPRE